MITSSPEPAVNLTAEKTYPVVPTSFVTFVRGSSAPVSTDTEPIDNVALIVWPAPTIGSDPETVAPPASTPITER